MSRLAAAAIPAVAILLGCAVRDPSSPRKGEERYPLPQSAPFVHIVLFKSKSATPEADARELVKDIREILAPLPTVKGLWVGSPAPTNTRPIVDANYDIGLLVLFEDQEGLQAYLDHPRHVEFAKKHDTGKEVRVFDFTPKS